MWPSEKFVPLLNIFFSLAAIGLQVATYLIWVDLTGLRRIFYSWDLVSSGIWGGFFVFITSALILGQRVSDRTAVRVLVTLNAICGLAMVGMYAWAINAYMTTGFGRFNQSCVDIGNFYRFQACESLTVSSLFIIIGSVIFSLNCILLCKSSAVVEKAEREEIHRHREHDV